MATNSPGARRPQVPVAFGQFGGLLSVALFLISLLVFGISVDRIRSQTSIIEQMPYLLSGGMVGLALVIMGSALMIVQKGREDRASLEKRIESLVEAVLAGSSSTATGGSGSGSAVPGDLSSLVVAGSASYHVPTCRLVDGRESVDYLTPAEARERALKPCRVCRPDEATTTLPAVRG